MEMLKDRGIYDLAKLNQFGENNADAVRKLPSYHVIILALNEVGRVNLYTLISMSHLKYYARRQEFQRANCRNTEKDFWWEVPVRRENFIRRF